MFLRGFSWFFLNRIFPSFFSHGFPKMFVGFSRCVLDPRSKGSPESLPSSAKKEKQPLFNFSSDLNSHSPGF